jgi:hypothetical protein
VPLTTGFFANFSRIRPDGRTRLAKTIARLKDDLADHLGGNPNPAQRILIDRIAHKTVKIMIYESGLLERPDEPNRDYYAAMCNSLRLDLIALGIRGKGQEPPSIEEYLKQKESTKPGKRGTK